MPGQSSRTYQIEHWVHSNLHAYNTELVHFKVGEAEVTLFLPAQTVEADGFCARTTLRSITVQEAEHMAHDILRKVLNALTYTMKASAQIVRPVRSQVEGMGHIRQCAVYWPGKPGIPILWDNPATEVQRLLNAELPKQTERALSWLRWAYSAQTLPEAFVFLRMALEQLAGEKRRESTCQYCQQPLHCPDHGISTYPSVDREKIKEILDRLGAALSKQETRLRNKLIHGGMDYDASEWMSMMEVYRQLRSAVAEELGRCLPQSSSSWISPQVTSNVLCFANCQYQTAYPSEPLPQDCVRADDIQESLTFLQHGHQHPKVITLLEWPPQW
jgi:hypothetical protein